ncbi:hypothetical protein P3T76_012580 [Phytophthora citrophthora]|uniref:Uncharacterized protein n=1 Tax=Phytophthora citrophthora TaxID=4793 RepID=A0AAD9G598_9STRA|nr:hypothetical protein P3T76_012580 [Phytophthora citrophthora]
MDCSDVKYDGNYGGWYPTGCKKIPDQAVIYGIGSYITGDSLANAGLDGVYDINGERMEIVTGNLGASRRKSG